MKTKNKLIGLALLALALLIPAFAIAQDAASTPSQPGDESVISKVGAVVINMEDMGLAIAFVLLLGGVIKNYSPIDNKFIPLITWILGGLLYQWLAGGWTDPRQWMMALISVAGATGLHSATRSTAAIANPGPLALLLCAGMLGGCGTLYDSIVTIKDVGDSISREYAQLWKAGLITPEQDAKVEQAHATYREAMGALAVALETAQSTGDASSVPGKLRAAKAAITPVLNLITPLLTHGRAVNLNNQLMKARAQ